jgi:hypothetical protein
LSGSENIYKPSADAAREKTVASIKAMRQESSSKSKSLSQKDDSCDVIKKMASVENPVNTASPNATNISR